MIFSGDVDVLYPPMSPSTLGSLSAAIDDQAIRDFMIALWTDNNLTDAQRGPILLEAMAKYGVSFDDIVRATGTQIQYLYPSVGLKPPTINLTPNKAKELMYRATTGGVPTYEIDQYGGIEYVMKIASAAGFQQDTASIMQYEKENNLPPSRHTLINSGTAEEVLENLAKYKALDEAEAVARQSAANAKAASDAAIQARQAATMAQNLADITASSAAYTQSSTQYEADQRRQVEIDAANAAQATLNSLLEIEKVNQAADEAYKRALATLKAQKDAEDAAAVATTKTAIDAAALAAINAQNQLTVTKIENLFTVGATTGLSDAAVAAAAAAAANTVTAISAAELAKTTQSADDLIIAGSAATLADKTNTVTSTPTQTTAGPNLGTLILAAASIYFLGA
jgi:hypothetical protein